MPILFPRQTSCAGRFPTSPVHGLGWRSREPPLVTVQLPIYNERYVIGRLLRAVCSLDYPRDRLEIQVLDDSTDDTSEITRRLIVHYQQKGHSLVHIRRLNRHGFKAGALKEGMEKARGLGDERKAKKEGKKEDSKDEGFTAFLLYSSEEPKGQYVKEAERNK